MRAQIEMLGTPDDLFTVNDLHLPVDEKARSPIKSMDVLHSFFLPNVRVKQDVVPGMKQYVWFTPDQDGHLRHRLCRAVRLGPLQDEGPHDGRASQK